MTYRTDADETIEDLQLNGLQLIQKKDAFRFGMDSVLLADFAAIRPGDTVADLGTGNGILMLLLYGRNKGNRYYAIDIQEEAADLARRNAILNRLEDRITVIQSTRQYAIRRTGSLSRRWPVPMRIKPLRETRGKIRLNTFSAALSVS